MERKKSEEKLLNFKKRLWDNVNQCNWGLKRRKDDEQKLWGIN